MHASIKDPSKSKQIKSAYKHQANLSGNIHKVFKSKHFEFFIMSATNCVATWACSVGGPGRNFGEHRGGSSTLGIKKPSSATSALGWQSS